MSTKNDTFLRALRGQVTDYTPVWLMRQAGRYLPEYNATRARAGSFMALCKTPELACEVTLQPLARFPLDAAILFSDILTIPDAMNLGLSFQQGEGPRFEKTIRHEDDVKALFAPDPAQELGYVLDAVRTIRQALDDRVPLIGFAGSPWTLACYMVEGRGGTDFHTIKTMMYQRPDLLHRVLEINTRAVTNYLNAQIEAGAQAVMIFDTWGGILADGPYQRFSLAYMRRILSELTPYRKERNEKGETVLESVPTILFTKGGAPWLEALAASGANAIGIDWTMNLATARKRVGPTCVLQGNLDPMALLTSPEQVREQAIRTLDSYGAANTGRGHVFNLGHGISQFTPPEHVSVLVETVHEHSRKLRRSPFA